jgi:hypothetical protein
MVILGICGWRLRLVKIRTGKGHSPRMHSIASLPTSNDMLCDDTSVWLLLSQSAFPIRLPICNTPGNAKIPMLKTNPLQPRKSSMQPKIANTPPYLLMYVRGKHLCTLPLSKRRTKLELNRRPIKRTTKSALDFPKGHPPSEFSTTNHILRGLTLWHRSHPASSSYSPGTAARMEG